MILRDDQTQLVDSAVQAFKRTRNVLLQAPTGSGKTAVSCYSASRAYQKSKTVWFVVPRRELIRQTAQTMERFNIPFSYIAAGYAMNPYARVHICSLQTITARLDKLKAPDLCIIDEVHIGAGALDQLVKWLQAARSFVMGLSATPWRSDGQGLGKWFGQMVLGPSIRWLIDEGHLSQYRAFAPSKPDLSGVKVTAGDYNKGSLSSFMEEDRILIGDAVRHYRQNAMGRLNLVYATSRKHSEMIAAQFRDSGVPAMHIDGETPDHERQRIIKSFGRRELLCLTSVDLINTGFDLSSQCGFDVTIEAMSDLRPTKSVALQLQKFGRVLRKKPYPAIIHDHSNNVAVHGLPCADREWTLADRERRGSSAGEKTIPTRQCTNCFFVHRPAPACLNCGQVYPVQSREIDHVDGELLEVTEMSPADQAKRLKRQQQGMAKSLDDLTKVGIARGMEPWKATRWAAKIITAREAKK